MMMNQMRRAFALMLTAMLCLAVFPAAQAEGSYLWGSQMPDFSLVSCDGKTITLSEVLKEKKMVLLDFWASWCGPCERQFPYLQAAYAMYQDDVEVIAVSCEPNATNADLQAYAQEHKLTFPVAQDTADLAAYFGASTIPMSVVIDRFGMVTFMHTGAVTETDAFARLFDVFVDDAYTVSRTLSDIPAMRPNIPKAEEAKLAEALNPEMAFRNPVGTYVWPMIPAMMDERLCLMSTNTNADDMYAAVDTNVQAKAGDVLAVTFKLSSEVMGDFFQLLVNGEKVKVFSGERDWMTYAHAFQQDGSYDVSLRYVKDAENSVGEDLVYIDEVKLLSGAAAAEALAGNPVYPAATNVTELSVTTEGVRRIVFEDPTFGMLYLFGLADYYILPGTEVSVRATLAADVDPEGAAFVSNYDGRVVAMNAAMTEDGYAMTSTVDSTDSTGYPYTTVSLVPSPDAAGPQIRQVVCFAGEENVEQFLAVVKEFGLNVTGWKYAE